MKKLKVIVKKVKTPCYECSEIGGIPTKKNKCRCCKGTGKYTEKTYYHIYKGQCFDGDTLK